MKFHWDFIGTIDIIISFMFGKTLFKLYYLIEQNILEK